MRRLALALALVPGVAAVSGGSSGAGPNVDNAGD